MMISEVPKHPSDSLAVAGIIGAVEVQLKFRKASHKKG